MSWDDEQPDEPGFLEEMAAAARNVPPGLDAVTAAVARHVAFLDQMGAGTRTHRTQMLCGRCNGPYLLACLRAAPEGDCGCERRCGRAGCLAPADDAELVVPDCPFA